MYFHASQTPNLSVLEPRVSNHGTPLIYFFQKRENCLVYLSNAVEKFCRETGFPHTSPWTKWGPYGFTTDGLLQLDKYYPNALAETYRGVSGYIYAVEAIPDPGAPIEIPGVVTSRSPVPVLRCEFVADALAEILKAEQHGLLAISRYETMTDARRRWVAETIEREYRDPAATPEYRYFLKAKLRLAD